MNQTNEMKIINAPGYSIQFLAKVMPNTKIGHHFVHIETNLSQLCARFTKILEWDLDTEEFAGVLLGACILYLNSNKLNYCSEREALLANTILQISTMDPMYIHIIVDCLWSNLKTPEIESSMNLLTLGIQIARTSIVGRIISSCIMWALLADICGRSDMITMHRYREFSELMEMIKSSQWSNGLNVSNTPQIIILTLGIYNLLNNVVFADKDTLLNAGYPDHFMNLDPETAQFMFSWLQDIIDQLDKLDLLHIRYIIHKLQRLTLYPMLKTLESFLEPIDVDNDDEVYLHIV